MAEAAEARAERIRDEIEAMEAMYGDELEVMADGLDAGLPVTLRLCLRGAAASLELLLPAGYPGAEPAVCSFSAASAPPGVTAAVGAALAACAAESSGRECCAEVALLAAARLEDEWPVGQASPAPGSRTEEKTQAFSAAPEPPVVALLKFNHLLEGKAHAKEAELVAAARRFGLLGWVVYGTPGLILAEAAAADLEGLLAESRRIGKRGEVLYRTSAGRLEDAALPKKGLAVAAGLPAARDALAKLGLAACEFNKLVL